MILTIPQLATLAYLEQVREVTKYHPSNGTIPMQRLTKMGLLYESDTSYGMVRSKTWTITEAGKEHIRLNQRAAGDALEKQGWTDCGC